VTQQTEFTTELEGVRVSVQHSAETEEIKECLREAQVQLERHEREREVYLRNMSELQNDLDFVLQIVRDYQTQSGHLAPDVASGRWRWDLDQMRQDAIANTQVGGSDAVVQAELKEAWTKLAEAERRTDEAVASGEYWRRRADDLEQRARKAETSREEQVGQVMQELESNRQRLADMREAVNRSQSSPEHTVLQTNSPSKWGLGAGDGLNGGYGGYNDAVAPRQEGYNGRMFQEAYNSGVRQEAYNGGMRQEAYGGYNSGVRPEAPHGVYSGVAQHGGVMGYVGADAYSGRVAGVRGEYTGRHDAAYNRHEVYNSLSAGVLMGPRYGDGGVRPYPGGVYAEPLSNPVYPGLNRCYPHTHTRLHAASPPHDTTPVPTVARYINHQPPLTSTARYPHPRGVLRRA